MLFVSSDKKKNVLKEMVKLNTPNSQEPIIYSFIPSTLSFIHPLFIHSFINLFIVNHGFAKRGGGRITSFFVVENLGYSKWGLPHPP